MQAVGLLECFSKGVVPRVKTPFILSYLKGKLNWIYDPFCTKSFLTVIATTAALPLVN